MAQGQKGSWVIVQQLQVVSHPVGKGGEKREEEEREWSGFERFEVEEGLDLKRCEGKADSSANKHRG